MRRRRPKTVMMRIRKRDLDKLKKMADEAQKQLPDFQTELIKAYKKRKKNGIYI